MTTRIVLASLAFLGLGCAQRGAPPRTVASLDVDRYLGTWYEIASYPTWFQRKCVATQATYSKRDDGRLGVANACRSRSFDGAWKGIEGIAWPVVPGDFSKLKVQFFWPIRGDYWVLALDPDYSWALVGHPNREYLWVLSRTRTLDDATYRRILELASAQGFDTARLRRTPQPAP